MCCLRIHIYNNGVSGKIPRVYWKGFRRAKETDGQSEVHALSGAVSRALSAWGWLDQIKVSSDEYELNL